MDLRFKFPEAAGGTDDPVRFKLSTEHSAPMGPFYGKASLPDVGGADDDVRFNSGLLTFDISDTPQVLRVEGEIGKPTDIKIFASSPISSVTATLTGTFSHGDQEVLGAQARVQLTDIPISPDEPVRFRLAHEDRPAAPDGIGRGSDDDGFKVPPPYPCGEKPGQPVSGDGAKRPLESVPVVNFSAPGDTVDGAFHIDAAFLRFPGKRLTATVETFSFAFTDIARKTDLLLDDKARTVKIVSDEGVGSRRTGQLWLQAGFELTLPCMEIDIPQQNVAKLLDVRGHGRLDGLRLNIPRVQLLLNDVAHVTLTAGPNYLAYEVRGAYGLFQLAALGGKPDRAGNPMPAVTLESDSYFDIRIDKGYYWGVPWYQNRFQLRSPEGGWHTLYSHLMKDEFGPSTLEMCVQIGPFRIPDCIQTFQRPHTTAFQANAATFIGADRETTNIFTFLDPGDDWNNTVAIDFLTGVYLAPRAPGRKWCLFGASDGTACAGG